MIRILQLGLLATVLGDQGSRTVADECTQINEAGAWPGSCSPPLMKGMEDSLPSESRNLVAAELWEILGGTVSGLRWWLITCFLQTGRTQTTGIKRGRASSGPPWLKRPTQNCNTVMRVCPCKDVLSLFLMGLQDKEK